MLKKFFRNSKTNIFIMLLFGMSFENASAKAIDTYTYHPPESTNDRRYEYHWKILKTALEETKKQFGSFSLKAGDIMNENRQIAEMKSGSKSLTVMIRETSKQHEELFFPVRIPIDRDLISYRVFLIRKKDQEKFTAVKNLVDLKNFSFGQGEGWGDVEILRANQFKVVTSIEYDNLFKMLMNNRFDIFSRGVGEVIDELEQRKKTFPDMTIENSILFYYPLPTYFFFQKNESGKKLARRIEQGMRDMIKNGRYEKIFQEYFGKAIEYHQLKKRKFFRVDNPFLPAETPFSSKDLWFDPFAP